MKAILMSAMKPEIDYRFPADPKPISLYHYEGQILLERQISLLRANHIDEIVIVGGWKVEQIEAFIKEKNYNIKVLSNPDAINDSWCNAGHRKMLKTVEIGLGGLEGDDDILLIFGDVILNHFGIKTTIEHATPCLSVWSHHGWIMYKIPKELLPKLRELCRIGQEPRECIHCGKTHELGGTIALHDFCLANGGSSITISNPDIIYDLDWYFQTDEGQTGGCRG